MRNNVLRNQPHLFQPSEPFLSKGFWTIVINSLIPISIRLIDLQRPMWRSEWQKRKERLVPRSFFKVSDKVVYVEVRRVETGRTVVRIRFPISLPSAVIATYPCLLVHSQLNQLSILRIKWWYTLKMFDHSVAELWLPSIVVGTSGK